MALAQNECTQTLLARWARLDDLHARSRAAMAERSRYYHEVNFTPQPYVITRSSPAPGRCAAQPKHIYGLVDPYTMQLRYIGQSVDVAHRLLEHCAEDRWTCPRKREWLDDLKPTGRAPMLWFLDSVLPRRADMWELLYIRAARGMGQPLCNDAERWACSCAWDAGPDVLEQAKQRTQERLMRGPVHAHAHL